MPTTPTADPTQKALLQQLQKLSQTDAVNSGNQITALNKQVSDYTNGKNLFQGRYDYWDLFITRYELERRNLDGQYVGAPLTAADFTQFLAQAGRLFNPALPTPARLAPVRIPEFDGGGLVYDLASDENDARTKETNAANLLKNGFSSPSFPTGFTTDTTLTPSSTTLDIENSSSAVIPTGVRIAVSGSGTAAICLVTGVTPQPHVLITDPWIYTLNITVETGGFTPIATNAAVLNSLPGFTNAERTAKVASIPSRQGILNGMISSYSAAVTTWKNLLQNQRNAIVSMTTEDAPDTAYVANQLAALNQLIAYFPAVLVSDAALNANQTLNTSRGSAITARIPWIAARLSAAQTKAYDQRYTYADRVNNLTDGLTTTVNTLAAQATQVAAQQVTSNARAATYAGEIF